MAWQVWNIQQIAADAYSEAVLCKREFVTLGTRAAHSLRATYYRTGLVVYKTNTRSANVEKLYGMLSED